MTITRKTQVKLTRPLYKHLSSLKNKENIKICGYCGDIATTLDHVTPVSYLFSLLKAGHEKKGYIIDSCLECNLLASNKIFDTFENKQMFIQNAIRRKYKKVLKYVDWSDEEIETMEESFKTNLRAIKNYKKWVKDRIGFENHYPDLILR
jgi:hypothetical protein